MYVDFNITNQNKMNMKPNLFLVMITMSFTLAFYSCTKDEINPSNPYNGKSFAIFNRDVTYGTLTDQDGNEYKTIKIGTQTWMAENLRTTKYRNGENIQKATNSSVWSSISSGGYCNFNNTEDYDTISTYGRLYNWYAVNDSRKIAPSGWHIPSDAEWTIMINYLGGELIAGGRLKMKESLIWMNLDPNITNESGFTAIRAGSREWYTGRYDYACGFWSSTQADDQVSSWYRYLEIGYNGVMRYNPNKSYGFSIRCVKN